ncbi:MAG: thioredoxin [Polyangia bacterium]|jgi:thioredoxin 1
MSHAHTHSHHHIKVLTDASFSADVLQSDKPTLVDFWATWCAPCRAIAPHVEKLADKFSGKLNVGKMDIDSNPKIATSYDVRSIPTLLIFHKGKVIGQLVGAAPLPKIEAFVTDALNKAG